MLETVIPRLDKHVEITVPRIDSLKSALNNLGTSNILDSVIDFIINRMITRK